MERNIPAQTVLIVTLYVILGLAIVAAILSAGDVWQNLGHAIVVRY